MMVIYHIYCCVSDVSEEDQDKTTSTVHSKQSVGKSNLSISTIKTILELLSDEAVSEYAVTEFYIGTKSRINSAPKQCKQIEF